MILQEKLGPQQFWQIGSSREFSHNAPLHSAAPTCATTYQSCFTDQWWIQMQEQRHLNSMFCMAGALFCLCITINLQLIFQCITLCEIKMWICNLGDFSANNMQMWHENVVSLFNEQPLLVVCIRNNINTAYIQLALNSILHIIKCYSIINMCQLAWLFL